MDARQLPAPVAAPDDTSERAAAHAPPAPNERAAASAGRPWWVRMEYLLLAAIAGVLTLFTFLFFYFDIDYQRLTSYGYIGLFAVSLISAASIVMPMPGAFAITGAGAVLDPVLGIPVPIMVGIVAGPAEAIGELTGYAAGYGGSLLFRDRPFYPRVHRWMERRGVLTLFALSSFPNPLVDVAGVAAGAVRMPMAHFMLGVLPGKFVKNVYLATGGWAGGELIRHLLG
jgi:membrane protein YqaA with SNARE-associated domain